MQVISFDAVLWPSIGLKVFELVFSLPLSIGLLAFCQALGFKVIWIKIARVLIKVVVVVNYVSSVRIVVRVMVRVVVWIMISLTTRW